MEVYLGNPGEKFTAWCKANYGKPLPKDPPPFDETGYWTLSGEFFGADSPVVFDWAADYSCYYQSITARYGSIRKQDGKIIWNPELGPIPEEIEVNLNDTVVKINPPGIGEVTFTYSKYSV